MPYRFFFRCRVLLNCAYSVTSSRFALLLATIGLYGVLAYAVGRRTNEIGIRMALGVFRRNVLWMVFRETLGLVLAGIVVGLALTFVATRLVGNFLFGLTPADPLTMH